jgi:hypothetical protein
MRLNSCTLLGELPEDELDECCAVVRGRAQARRDRHGEPLLRHRDPIDNPAARFSYRTGTVEVKVISSGKIVQIDALAISRT